MTDKVNGKKLPKGHPFRKIRESFAYSAGQKDAPHNATLGDFDEEKN